MKLAIISDLHVGTNARSSDLCLDANSPKPDNKYIDTFLRFIQDKRLSADYLILPGDITDSAKPKEVELAAAFIEKAASALGVGLSRIAFVPGNHDVDWSVLGLGDDQLRVRQRFDPLKGDRIIKQVLDAGAGDLLADPHFAVWNFDDLFVLGYNSAHHDKPGVHHHGLLSPSNLEAMKAYLDANDHAGKIKLFLVHHHPFQYAEPVDGHADHSIMINAELLHRILHSHKFDLLIHGHRHLPRFMTHRLDGAGDIGILCAGSFSVLLDTRWAGTITNQFHLIEIDGRDQIESLIRGRILSWKYTCKSGWQPSTYDTGGIDYIEPFGAYTRPASIDEQLTPLIEDAFQISDYIAWDALVAGELSLKHLRPEAIRQSLERLSKQLRFILHGDVPRNYLLLKV